jgi:hypothetical protein
MEESVDLRDKQEKENCDVIIQIRSARRMILFCGDVYPESGDKFGGSTRSVYPMLTMDGSSPRSLQHLFSGHYNRSGFIVLSGLQACVAVHSPVCAYDRS